MDTENGHSGGVVKNKNKNKKVIMALEISGGGGMIWDIGGTGE